MTTPAASASPGWREIFHNWPADVPRRGIIVTSWDEQFPFEGFAAGPGFLFLDRATPDSLGARKMILAYTNLVALKFTDVIKSKSFAALGFVSPVKA